MAVSGTVGQFDHNVAVLIEQAIIKTGKPKTEITAETVQTSVRELNLLLSGFTNRGPKLWTYEKIMLGLTMGQQAYELPVGTLDIRTINYRQQQRALGDVTTSDAGGTVAYGFDSDLETILTQISPNGSVKIDYGSQQQIASFGYLPGVSSSMHLVVEWSDDDTTWNTALDCGADDYTDAIWQWFDFPIIQSARYFRVRETGGGTIVAREIYLGQLATEIPMYRMNVDDYWNIPNKAYLTQPTQFWLDRKRVAPVINLWGVPSNPFVLINMLVTRHIMDVTEDISQDVEIPQRWFDYIMWALAKRLVTSGIGDRANYSMIKQELAEVNFDAEAEERDDSPINLQPNITPYTRG